MFVRSQQSHTLLLAEESKYVFPKFTFRVINYLNLVEKIIRNRNVDEVSVPIISKDIR